MKLAVILPGAVSPGAEKEIEALASPGTEVVVLGASEGLLAVAGDIDLKGPEAAMLAMQAEKDGCEAVVIDGMCDFGLNIVRGAVNIPVVGAATATYNLVYQLARSFGAVSINKEMTPMFLRAIRECGCEERMTSMRSLERPLRMTADEFEMPYTPEDWEAELIKTARPQVEEEGAQCIVVTCASIFGILPEGARERMQEALGVIVVDPQPIAIKTAEMLASLNLCHSKIEYPGIDPVSFDHFIENKSELRKCA